jgi:integrase
MGRANTGSVWFDHQGNACRDRYHRRCTGRWSGQVSLGKDADGKRIRPKVTGATKDEVLEKIRKLQDQRGQGIKPKAGYTVEQCLDDWFARGLPGRSAKTVQTYREVTTPLLKIIGRTVLVKLTAPEVHRALVKLGKGRSTRTLQIAHRCLVRAITQAQAADLVSRNVAALVGTPEGQAPGRPSQSLTVLQARHLIHASAESRWHAYVILSLTSGMRTEELRALKWSEVDLDEPSVAVYRSVRSHGDTKTRKSRRKLKIPQMAADALVAHSEQQDREREAAGERWQEHDLVFASTVGTPLDASHVRRSFRVVCKEAGIGENWTPRELRHSFVSIMSSAGAPIEQIARLAGHSVTSTTESVYRHAIQQKAMEGAEILGPILSRKPRRVVRRNAATDEQRPGLGVAGSARL